MKKSYYILFLGLVLLPLAYLIFPNQLPPRTPLKVARLISGLEISKEIEVEMIQDDWALNGDGTTYVKARLTDRELSELIRQATQKDYKSLPLPHKNIPVGIADGINGYYFLELNKDDSRDYTLTVIDSDKKEITVYIDYM